MKPLIVHIRASNFYGGPERQIIGHIKTSRSFRHLVVTFKDNEQENEFIDICREEGVNVAVIETKGAYQIKLIQFLRELLVKQAVDCICCHGYKPLILCFLSTRRLDIPIIAFSRGHTSENVKIRIFEFIERKLLRYVPKIISVSDGYAKFLIKAGIEESRITVVRNAVDFKKFRPFIAKRNLMRTKLGFEQDDFIMATAGRLSPEKAQDVLIDAFSRLINVKQNHHLLLFGEGPLRRNLEQQVETLKLNNVYFMGHRNDLDEIMPVIDLFVLPSMTEGLPNVLLEAGAAHVPMVATSVGGVPEIIEQDRTGLMVEAGNRNQLTEAIKMCIEDEEKCASFSDAAYRLIEKKYGFAKQSNLLESVYSELVGKG